MSPVDIEGEKIVPGLLRILRQAAIPNIDVFRFIQIAHGPDTHVDIEAWPHAAIRSDGDTRRFGFIAQSQLLANGFSVSAQIRKY